MNIFDLFFRCHTTEKLVKTRNLTKQELLSIIEKLADTHEVLRLKVVKHV